MSGTACHIPHPSVLLKHWHSERERERGETRAMREREREKKEEREKKISKKKSCDIETWIVPALDITLA